MSKFLDETGLKALWAKIKALIPTSLPANGGNADTVDGFHASSFPYRSGVGYNRSGPYYKKIASADFGTITWGWRYLILDLYSNGYSGNKVYLGKFEISVGHWNNTDKNVTVYSRWIWKGSNAYDCIVTVKDLSTNHVDVYAYNTMWDASFSYVVIAQYGFSLSTKNAWTNLPEESDTVSIIKTTYLDYVGNSSTATKLQTARTLTLGSTGKSFDGSGNVSWSLSEIGAAASSHTHTKSQITDFPSSLKNPNALVMQANGTQVGSYDGSSAVTVNITPSSIGAATTSVATTSANGLMSSTDKSNLDRSIYDVQDNLSGDTYKLNFYSNGGSNNTEIEIPVATTSAAGLMSKGDKANLDGAVTTAVVSGGGNAITTASISGHTLTLTKGSTFSLSNHTHSQYLTSVPVATTSALGGVKSTAISMHMTDRDYYAEVGSDGKICVNIPWTDTNTKNTAGSTNTSSKIYLIGATSQAANPQTYSNSGCYINTNGQLVSNGSVVITEAGGEVDELYCNGSITIDDELIMNDGTIQTNKLKLPTTSGGSTYGVGSSGQVLKSNGSTVYWANDNNTTYSAATTTTSGLMSANDKKLLNAVAGQNTFTYLRSATTSLYIPLFKFTKVATSLNGISVSIPPIMDIEFVIGYYNGSTVALGGQLKCTICLSSSPSIKWTVRNVTNSTYFGYIASLVYDKTNNAILLKCSSSAPAGVVVHAIAYNCAHSTVASYTSTSVGTISTFSVPTSVSIN